MTIKHPPFEDVFPIEHGDFPKNHVSFQGCMGSKSENLATILVLKSSISR